MAEVKITLADEDYEGQVALNIDFNPELKEGMTDGDLTPAQKAALWMMAFANTEIFGPDEEGNTLGGAVDEALGRE